MFSVIRYNRLNKLWKSRSIKFCRCLTCGVIAVDGTVPLARLKCSSSFKSVISKNTLNFSTNLQELEAVDQLFYEKVCEETLESLAEYFEELIQTANNLPSADVAYSSGVLTVQLGGNHGTYVINRQSPNKQIWLSSPTSGPKRYDFSIKDSCWVYRHDGRSLHRLLQEEISKIVDCEVDFSNCMHGKV